MLMEDELVYTSVAKVANMLLGPCTRAISSSAASRMVCWVSARLGGTSYEPDVKDGH